MTKARKKAAGEESTLRIETTQQKSKEARLAEVGLDPAATNMATSMLFSKGTFGDLALTEVYQEMRAKVAAVRKGCMDGPEALLVGQATSLNLIFTELARRSAANMGEYIDAADRYMRLALKAQAQCRATIETLAAMKNPPVVIARQANISGGHQQINNHAAPASRAEISKGAPNELLEAEDEVQRMESGAPGAPAGGDPRLETVGAVDGAKEPGGEAPLQPKR